MHAHLWVEPELGAEFLGRGRADAKELAKADLLLAGFCFLKW